MNVSFSRKVGNRKRFSLSLFWQATLRMIYAAFPEAVAYAWAAFVEPLKKKNAEKIHVAVWAK